jgi:hypothetical protein
MEIAFPMCNWGLKIFLLECWRDSEYFRIDFADKDRWAARRTWEFFQRSYFWSYSCSKEAGLAFRRWREYGEAGLDIWKHAAVACGK